MKEKDDYKRLRKEGLSGTVTITKVSLDLRHQSEELFSKIDPIVVFKSKSSWV